MICGFCEKEFKPETWRARKFCSIDCYKKDKKLKESYRFVTKKCENCGNEFTNKYRPQRFCSVKCRGEYMKGKNHGSYKGGKTIISFVLPSGHNNQYVKVRCGGKGMAEHRLVAEAALGRPLKKREIIHHINCDSLDNRNENLLVCSQSYHAWLHNRMSHLYAKRFLDTRSIGA